MEFNIINRTEYDNCRFCDYIASAIDKIEQAISNITYPSNLLINVDARSELASAVSILEETLDNVNCLKKPE